MELERAEKMISAGDCGSHLYARGFSTRICDMYEAPMKESGTFSRSKCPACQAAEIKDAIELAGLPSRHLKRFGELEQTPSVKRAREWAEHFPDVESGLLLVGDVGRGKTQIAVTIALELIHRRNSRTGERYRPTYEFVPELCERMRDFDCKNDEPSRLADLIILDDLGSEHSTSYSLNRLSALIDRLYQEERVLIVTSNLGPEETLEHVGERALSRLVQMTVPVVLEGRDRRRG